MSQYGSPVPPPGYPDQGGFETTSYQEFVAGPSSPYPGAPGGYPPVAPSGPGPGVAPGGPSGLGTPAGPSMGGPAGMNPPGMNPPGMNAPGMSSPGLGSAGMGRQAGGGRGGQSVVFGVVIGALVLLLIAVAVGLVVEKGRADDYQAQAQTSRNEVDAVRRAESDQRRAFDNAGLKDLYTKFDDALKEVTRTGNAIDNAASDSAASPLYPAYRAAMLTCRTEAASYNKAARPFPPKLFEGSDLPPVIDTGDTKTNCIDDAGES